ncbi:hypothetical protein AAG906_004831 [Vitis piasezkii]
MPCNVLGWHTTLKEIEEVLQHIYDSYPDGNDMEGDIYNVALQFRDVRGMLGLYEAAHLRVNGEDILDEALAFTTTHLRFREARGKVVYLAKLDFNLLQSLHKEELSNIARKPISGSICDRSGRTFALTLFCIVTYRKDIDLSFKHLSEHNFKSPIIHGSSKRQLLIKKKVLK